MFSIIKRCLFLGLDLRADKKKKMGEYVLEARFEPENKVKHIDAAIYVPVDEVPDLIAKHLNGAHSTFKQNVETWIEATISQYDNNGLIRLLVVMAHEIGHFISYCLGNHTTDLADGITLMHRGDVVGYDKITSLVFVEEVIAWDHAEQMLNRYEFVWLDVFNKVKLDSLGAYFKLLQLNKATVSVFARLSMIDEFRTVSESNYF